MYSVPGKFQPATPPYLVRQRESSKQLYFAMLDERGGSAGQIDELANAKSRSLLLEQLVVAAEIDTDFPTDMRSLPSVLHNAHDQAAQAYRRYLDGRHAGSPRRYFSCRAHALYFLRAVAPTKLVDGAWLYGVLARWQDSRLAPLIQTYLEELGCGNPAQNHVLLYRQLLARYGCDNWQDGPDGHFTQGAVQLALAHHAREFLPELIGFNLGYEQLPLHLLITAYELNELDIDPYYFSLHVTIDNASTGHARKALQTVLDNSPRTGDVSEFQRRVGNGFRLNLVGMGTPQAIESFDIEQELQRVFADKALIGAQLHSDYCLVGGRSVSDWLSSPGEIVDLLSALQSAGWIRRGESPEQSRFWRLLTDEQAPMFGVFDGYEQQLLKDWILADSGENPTARTTNRFRNRQIPGPVDEAPAGLQSGTSVAQIIARHASGNPKLGRGADVDALFQKLVRIDTKAEAFAVLTGLLSPANHPTPAGLVATRLYADLFQHVTSP
ncbi:iron-containing redox enzyme family protein [Marinobacter halophilus]|nr:iron-containing redox enzyme family protein [Marinobacter halophilus]